MFEHARVYGAEGADSLRGKREPSSVVGILPIGQSSFHGVMEKEVEKADFPLVGSGEAHLGCGSFFTVGCLNVEEHLGMNLDGQNMEGKAYLLRVRNSCDRPICPVCWESWATREVAKARKRLDAYVLKGRSLKVIHVTVSVPYADYGLSLIELRRKAYKALKNVHVLGGMLIYHSKRKSDAGIWFFSPHFHVLGYGWLTDVRKNYLYSGYVVKNIGIRKTVEGTIWYQLSHAGIDPKHHSVTWFGVLSYGKLKVLKDEKEDRVCPLCGGALTKLFWIGEGDFPLPDIEGMAFYDDPSHWMERTIFREYTV